MKTLEAKVIHYGHSSVLVETPTAILIFDYYYDNSLSEASDSNYLSLDQLKEDKDIYVFVSHGHGDHFNEDILKWQDINPDIKYIFSDDIRELVDRPKYYYMKEYEELELGNIYIQSFGTTDLGVSFLVSLDGISIFHAGDLNWWHWKKFSKEEQEREEVDFKREVDRILGNKIDLAFIPVDPRLEEYYHIAGEYFAQEVKPGFLVAIHFREDFSICGKFANVVKNLPVKVPEFSHLGQVIYL